MKKLIIISIAAFPFLLSSTCVKDNYKNTEAVRLNANISNTSETIALGDTLKITLTISGVIVTESAQNITVNSLQEGSYCVLCERFDTINRRAVGLNNTAAFFATQGSYYQGCQIFVTNTSNPYISVLNIVPPQKGVYQLHMLAQPGNLQIHSSSYYGLKVNFNAADKHWNMLAYYYNTYFNTNINEFLSVRQQTDSEGYGYYGFRVN